MKRKGTMRESKRQARPWATLLVATALAACGDDPSTLRFGGDNAEQMAESADGVTGTLEETTEVTASVTYAYFALLDMGGGSMSPMMPLEVAARVRTPFRAGAMPVPVAAGPLGVLIPDAMMGVTFVRDPETMSYVASEQSGAPANGARFVYYALDPFTYEPVQPLVPLGYVQLVDVSTQTAARLEVEVVQSSGNRVLADWFVEGAVTGNTQTTTITMTSDGFVSNGTRQVDFEVELTLSGNESTETVDEALDVLLESGDDAIRLDVEQHTAAGDTDVDGRFVVERGSNQAVFEFTGAGSVEEVGTVEGGLSFNGADVVVFAGPADNPEFTRPDGSALTAREVDALGRMWLAFVGTYAFVVFELFFPFLLLLTFSGF